MISVRFFLFSIVFMHFCQSLLGESAVGSNLFSEHAVELPRSLEDAIDLKKKIDGAEKSEQFKKLLREEERFKELSFLESHDAIELKKGVAQITGKILDGQELARTIDALQEEKITIARELKENAATLQSYQEAKEAMREYAEDMARTIELPTGQVVHYGNTNDSKPIVPLREDRLLMAPDELQNKLDKISEMAEKDQKIAMQSLKKSLQERIEQMKELLSAVNFLGLNQQLAIVDQYAENINTLQLIDGLQDAVEIRATLEQGQVALHMAQIDIIKANTTVFESILRRFIELLKFSLQALVTRSDAEAHFISDKKLLQENFNQIQKFIEGVEVLLQHVDVCSAQIERILLQNDRKSAGLLKSLLNELNLFIPALEAYSDLLAHGNIINEAMEIYQKWRKQVSKLGDDRMNEIGKVAVAIKNRLHKINQLNSNVRQFLLSLAS